MTASQTHNPADASPLTIEREHSGESNGTFTVLSGARLRCETCGTVSDAAQQCADDAARTEGASDPADMTIVVHLVCPSCGTSGMLTLGYGPEADPDASDVVAAMPRDPRGPGATAGRRNGGTGATASGADRDDADGAGPEGSDPDRTEADTAGADELSPGSDLARDEPPVEPNEPG
ncbi:MAG: hypothetical protein ACYC2O_08090 [Microthrixaceae bacterium]